MESLKLRAAGAFLVACSTLAGCTHFNAVRIPKAESPVPVNGAPYNLSFTQYEITVKRRLAACKEEDAAGKVKSKLIIAIEATPKASEQPDPLRDYVIDNESLQSIWKTTETQIKWNEAGRLESISASAQDKFGVVAVTVATAIAKTVVGAATQAAGSVDITKDGKTVTENTGACEPDIYAKVTNVKELEADIKQRTARLERNIKSLETYRSVATIMGKDLPSSDKERLSKLLLIVDRQTRKLDALQAQLEADLKIITYTDTIVWPPNGSTFGDAVVKTKPVKAIQILQPLTVEQIKKWGDAGDDATVLPQTSVLAKISPTSPIGITDPCTNECDEDKSKGLKYRPKAPGHLVICKWKDCEIDSDNEVGKDVGMISQLGRVYVIPLKSGVFSNKTLTATFDKVGQPTMIGVKSESSVAEGASTTTAAVLEQFVAARKAVVPSKLDRLKDELERRKLEKELLDIQKALAPTPNAETALATATFTADTALVDARLANLKAHATLDAIQASQNP